MPALTDEERETRDDRVTDLHSRGLGCRSIARELGCSPATVTATCQRLGLTFDREQTRTATSVRKTEASALRSELVLQLLEDAQALRAQIWQPHEYIDHGGKEFTEVRWTQDQPSPVDKLKLAQAAGNLIDRSIRLEAVDQGGEVEVARSMMGQLLAQLQVAVGEFDPAIAS